MRRVFYFPLSYRWLGWALFAGFLGLVGVCLFLFLPPRANWTVDIHNSAWLRLLVQKNPVVLVFYDSAELGLPGIEFRSLDDGQVRSSHLHDRPRYHHSAFVGKGLLQANDDTGRHDYVSFESGSEWTLNFPNATGLHWPSEGELVVINGKMPFDGKHVVSGESTTDNLCFMVTSQTTKREQTWLEQLLDFLPVASSERNQTRITLVDLEDAQEFWHMVLPGKMNTTPLLTEDGRKLITECEVNGKVRLQCWDVPPKRWWHWIVGVPAGLVAVGVAWRMWCSRRLLLRFSIVFGK
ncbi:MAG: hypothetical protein HY040_25940 [Planctomycetes bacterium]|nr:hypothetical protein [Planctomycetota bacterium]